MAMDRADMLNVFAQLLQGVKVLHKGSVHNLMVSVLMRLKKSPLAPHEKNHILLYQIFVHAYALTQLLETLQRQGSVAESESEKFHKECRSQIQAFYATIGASDELSANPQRMLHLLSPKLSFSDKEKMLKMRISGDKNVAQRLSLLNTFISFKQAEKIALARSLSLHELIEMRKALIVNVFDLKGETFSSPEELDNLWEQGIVKDFGAADQLFTYASKINTLPEGEKTLTQAALSDFIPCKSYAPRGKI